MADRFYGLRVTPHALGGFFALAALITFVVSVSFLVPGSLLDVIWRMNPGAYPWLQSHGPLAPIAFLLLSVIMAAASAGCFLRRRWGWRLAMTIFAVHGIVDAVRIVSGAPIEGLLGAFVSAALLGWLARPRIRRLFKGDTERW